MTNPGAVVVDLPDVPQRIGVGIDIGTTFSGVTLRPDQVSPLALPELIPLRPSQNFEDKFPSQVFVAGSTAAPKFFVGPEAIEAYNEHYGGSDPGELYGLFKQGLTRNAPYVNSAYAVTPALLTQRMVAYIKQTVENFLAQPSQRGWQQASLNYVFCYPGYWDQDPSLAARHAFNRSIESAGIAPGTYTLIEEPVAAAIGAAQLGPAPGAFTRDHNIFVLDFGGGTLDLAIVSPDAAHRIKQRYSVPRGGGSIGMSNFDKAFGMLFQRRLGMPLPLPVHSAVRNGRVEGREFEQAWRALADAHPRNWESDRLSRAEGFKRDVMDRWSKTTYPYFQVSLPEYDERLALNFERRDLQPFFDAMNKAVRAHILAYFADISRAGGFAPKQITHVVISGGGSGLPGLKETLNGIFAEVGRGPFDNGVELVPVPVRQSTSLVQRGAALLAHDPTLLSDRRANFTCGVEALYEEQKAQNERKTNYGYEVREIKGRRYWVVYNLIVKYNDPLPLPGQAVRTPYTPVEGAKEIVFKLYHGDNPIPNRNRPIGQEVKLSFPQGYKAGHKINCCLYVETDGRLYVYAQDSTTGQKSPSVMISPAG